MDPIIKDIYHLYKQLDRLKEMDPIKKLSDEGKGLVNKCLRIRSLNWYKRYTHSNKLTEYDVAVREKFQIYMPLLAARNHAEMLIKMDEIMSRWPGQANGGGLQSGLGTWGNLSVPAAPAFMVGSEVEASMREIKLRLLKGGVSVIVVTAPGGCGKTNLLTKLCHDGEIKGKFNNIMFVRVSRKPNLIDIVQQMYQHNSLKAPEIEAEDGAFSCLEQLLNRIGQDPVLLVLDDVWGKWESILKKFVCNSIKDYKIVVTSRYEFPYFRPVHHLKPLTHNEAVKLFRESVAVDDGSMDAPDDETLDQIVKRCKGLPLALTVVAKSLRGKDRPIWEKSFLIGLKVIPPWVRTARF
ncbi:probable disease resistance protein At5g66900 [Eucalyptus grandis]|uniref:probable disease resistance protein At5g66900 n=1 Tax=Eucalyptus grandis TaxID=71139 RepID=UPI00192EB5B3|nr:probable disease resistance protein At5g66900 [Eucalyptus grandis]XP_018718127.2 probable disease resistance protein At5g66900 [Eucalyptus grandis]